MVVGLLYVPVLFNYMLPSVGNASQRDMMVTLIYSAVTPVLNPLIYTLRNQEVKSALLKILGGKYFIFHWKEMIKEGFFPMVVLLDM